MNQHDQQIPDHPMGDPMAPPTGVRPDPRPIRGLWLLMITGMIFVGGLAYLQYSRVDEARTGRGLSTPTASRDLPVIGQLPEFSLTDQSARTITLADLKGKVWVADFIFTTCGGPCPLMTQRMRELQHAMVGRGITNVVCVSFTVDPETDTPAVLKEYARQFKANTDTWLFLTGNTEEIYDLSLHGFKLPAARSDDETHQVEHSPRFVLVDHLGRVRGFYEAITDDEMERPRAEVMDTPMPRTTRDRLLADIQWLLREVRR